MGRKARKWTLHWSQPEQGLRRFRSWLVHLAGLDHERLLVKNHGVLLVTSQSPCEERGPQSRVTSWCQKPWVCPSHSEGVTASPTSQARKQSSGGTKTWPGLRGTKTSHPPFRSHTSILPLPRAVLPPQGTASAINLQSPFQQ